MVDDHFNGTPAGRLILGRSESLNRATNGCCGGRGWRAGRLDAPSQILGPRSRWGLTLARFGWAENPDGHLLAISDASETCDQRLPPEVHDPLQFVLRHQRTESDRQNRIGHTAHPY